MIVKNEEVLLDRCLNSVKEFDEIVICDTGSTDKTIEIAKKYTDKVYTDYTWNDSFAEARNHAASKATSDWILVIDADEYLAKGDTEKIKHLLRLDILTASSNNVESTSLRAIDLTVASERGRSIHYQPRLHKNQKDIFWKGNIHNHLSARGDKRLDATIYYGYSPAHKNDPDRAIRILKKELEKNPNAPRETFYLAQSYSDQGKAKEAIEWYDKRIGLFGWNEEVYFSKFKRAKNLETIGEFPMSEYIEAYEYRPQRLEAIFEVVRHYRKSKKYNFGYILAKGLLETPFPKEDSLFVDKSINDWSLMDELSVCAYWTKNYQESFDLCQALLTEPFLPQSQRARVEGNLNFSKNKLPDKPTEAPVRTPASCCSAGVMKTE